MIAHEPPLTGADRAAEPHDALKLTTYFGERDRAGGRLLGDALIERFAAHRVQAGVLLRPIAGFGAHHRLHTERLLSLSEDLPVVAEATGGPERIEALLADVLVLRERGLVTLERARLLNGTPPALAPGEPVKLTVLLGRKARAGGAPAFVTLCRALHEAGADGACVLLGVDGVRGGERHRATFFGRNATVPLTITAIGDGGRIAAALAAAGPLPEAITTVESVQVCKRDGELLSRPRVLAAHDEHGRELWQKLTVYSPETHGDSRRPLHEAILSALRRRRASGATVLRGVWGFDGRRPPHGDRLLALRRHVPVMTVVVEAPPRIAEVFGELDRLTGSGGVITSELVPAAGGPDAGHERLVLGRLPPRV